MNIAGAVLCGGASRRMGADKALIPIDGVIMAERVALVLDAAGCQPVVFVGGDEQALAETGRTVYPDRWPGAGPVGGVITALRELLAADPSPQAVVVCACDLPDLTPHAVQVVVGHGASQDADVRVADSGRLEPMLACWSPLALGPLEQLFESGRSALHDVISQLVAVRVAVDSDVVRNVNMPNDLRKRRTRSTR